MALEIKNGTLISVSPRDGSRLGEVQTCKPETISAVVMTARTAFRPWSDQSFRARCDQMREAYRQFYLRKDEIAQCISDETGKPLVEAYSTEILPVLDSFRFYLKHTGKILKTRKISATNPLLKLRKGMVQYEPLGVIAVISPWNYPLLLAMQHIIPALLVGNAVIHKPSEQTSLTGLKIKDIFERAHLPDGVLQVVTGLADLGQALVEAKLDKIFFTGSTNVGRKIYQSAAQNLVPVNMELGGSDPMIVLEDANIERAVNGAVWGAFSNSGQACLSVERLYVQEGVFDRFVERLTAKARRLSFLNSASHAGEISCVANRAQKDKVSKIVAEAVQNGAVLKLGGSFEESDDLRLHPTVLTKDGGAVFRDEIFGPVVTVIPFDTDEKALALANDSEFGLAASVWTENRSRALSLAKRLQAASVMINDVQVHVAQPEAPYSGYKNSGLGASHGQWGLMELVKPKYINIDRPSSKALMKLFSTGLVDNNIWWFRYNNRVLSGFRAFADLLHGDTFAQRMKALPQAIRSVFRNDYL